MSKRRPLNERIADAEAKASTALGNANEAREKGRPTSTVERYEATAQKWLDAANRLRGHGDGSE